MDKGKWIVCILFGVLILVIAIPVDKKSEPLVKSEEQERENATRMEKRLDEILEQIEGVGRVEVMVTLEEDKGSLYSTREQVPKVLGVCVVAEGAKNPDTKVRIYEAVQALFGIEGHKISIVEMGTQEGT